MLCYNYNWEVIGMPSWNMHFALSKKLSKVFEVDTNTFIFASILPDISKENRHIAHFYSDKKYLGFTKAYIIDLEKFTNTYYDYLYDSLILGYYSHLLADYYFNTKFFLEKIVHNELGEVIGVKNYNNFLNTADMEIIKQMKHTDLESYGSFLYHDYQVTIPKFDDDIISSLSHLKLDFINESLIKEKIDYLNGKFKEEYCERDLNQYKIYTKRDYDFLFRDCLDFIVEKFEDIKVKKRS